jgi:inhibitor of cysteine peptidase
MALAKGAWQMVQVDESHNGSEIDLRTGEPLEIRLSENPTTGFRWGLESNGAPACILVEDVYETSSVTPGAGGNHRWRFQAAQIGEGRIRLGYRRSWEGQGAASRTFTLGVRVVK